MQRDWIAIRNCSNSQLLEKKFLDWLEGTCIGIDDGRNKKEKKERRKKRSSSTKITNGSVRTGEFAGKE